MRTIEKLTVLVVVFCMAGLANAEYLEDWESPSWAHNESIVNATAKGWGPSAPLGGANCWVKNLSTWLGETDSQVAMGGATAGGAVRALDVADIGTGEFAVSALIRVNVDGGNQSRAGLYLGNYTLAGTSFPTPRGFLTVNLRDSNWDGMGVYQYDMSALTDDAVVLPGVSFADNGWTELKIVANNATGAASVWYRNVVDNITPTPLEDWQLAYTYQPAQNYSFTHVGIYMEKSGMLDKLKVTPVPEPPVVFEDDFEEPVWSVGDWSGGAETYGEYMTSETGWLPLNAFNPFMVSTGENNPGRPGPYPNVDLRRGVAGSQATMEVYNAVGSGIGNTHSFDAQPGKTLRASVALRLDGIALPTSTYINGIGAFYLGDASLTDNGVADNAYKLTVGSAGASECAMQVLEGGVDTQGTAAFGNTGFIGQEWFELRICVSDVGLASQSARAEWRNLDDTTGDPTSDWTTIGAFDALEGALFDVTHVGFDDTEQHQGGASLIPWDNVLVTAVTAAPVSSTLGLLVMGLGAAVLTGLRRRRR